MKTSATANDADLDRFLALFQAQVSHTWDYVETIPADVWTTVPVESDENYLGLRVNRITVAALLRHLGVAETYWFETLADIDDGAVIAPPAGTGPLDNLAPGAELIEAYRTAHLAALKRIAQLSADQLRRTFTFVGRRFTVRGFLWAIYGHHCYHLGQIDQLLRQQNVAPPEFMHYAETERVIA